MRSEKVFFVNEITKHLDKSDYVYLSDFTGVSVIAISILRNNLRNEDAECHIVKNSILQIALKNKVDSFDESWFVGHTAVIVGGNNPSGVAKVLAKFSKDNENRMFFKGGLLSSKRLSPNEIKALAELPTLEVLRAKLLSLLGEPASGLVRILNAIPQNIVNVLQAKVRKEA
ncbi:MAG: 50S ribosomal protein L10 [Puniceicoccales bacterium]|jgi:large subunit ribosomal protein L10|nr:50S ribosomal protein L10 [Puniceicoccales bacterium]